MSTQDKNQVGHPQPGDKPKGWFSRRYQQDHAHRQAVIRYQGNHPRFNTEPQRKPQGEMNTDQLLDQLNRLDARLGKGQGARKERARIAALLASKG